MATQDLGFNVFALDRASRTFIRLADRIEKVSDRLDELDRKRANPEINLDVDERKIRGAVKEFADTADDEAKRRKGGFFSSMFRPNRQVVMALRTGIPAVLGSPIGLAGLALGGVFAASFAGAVISSGVFAAVGGGFTALAAVVLKDNERIKASFEDLAQTVKIDLVQAAQPLVPEFDRALSQVRRMFGTHIAEPLREIFVGLGPTIVPFAESAVRTVGNILNSLATPQFLTGMQTVLDEISDELPRIGQSIGDLFVKLAGNADDTADAFGAVVTVIDKLIDITGSLVVVLTDTFNRLSDIGNLLSDVTTPTTELAQALGLAEEGTGALEFAGGKLLSMFDMMTLNLRTQIPEWLGWTDSADEASGMTAKFDAEIRGLQNRLPEVSTNLEKMAAAEEQLADAINGANDAISHEQDKLKQLKDSLFTAEEGILGLRASTRDYQEQLDEASEIIGENGRTLDVNTDKGRENAEAIDDIAASALGHIQMMIEQGKSTEKVSKFTQRARDDFIKAARAAGMEEDAAKALADQLGLVPSEVETKIKAIDEMSATIEHLKRQLRELQRQAGVIPIGTSTGAFFGSALIPRGHDGGMITTTGIRRMHTGGTLRPDERHVIGLTGERILNRRETIAYNAGQAAVQGGSEIGGGVASFTVVNHGVIGSQRETEDWLTHSLDNLKRKGRLPV